MPFCGLAVIEELSGVKTDVVDPYLTEVQGWAYQDCQPHQAAVVDAVAALVGLPSAAPVGSALEAHGQKEARLAGAVRALLDRSGLDTVQQKAVLSSLLMDLSA